MSTFTLDTLRQNRHTLRAEWLRRVKDAKAKGFTANDFYATGPVLMQDFSLFYMVYVDGERAYDLGCNVSGNVHEVRMPGVHSTPTPSSEPIPFSGKLQALRAAKRIVSPPSFEAAIEAYDTLTADDIMEYPSLPKPCSRCGWQYPLSRLIACAEGEMTLDPNPTHLCW